MKRFVLKVNDSIYVKSVNWIINRIPVIKTGSYDDALILEESYLNESIGHNGYEQVVTRRDLILSEYPSIEFVKVKIVIAD